jgi:hypothetical protein
LTQLTCRAGRSLDRSGCRLLDLIEVLHLDPAVSLLDFLDFVPHLFDLPLGVGPYAPYFACYGVQFQGDSFCELSVKCLQ